MRRTWWAVVLRESEGAVWLWIEGSGFWVGQDQREWRECVCVFSVCV